MPSETANTSNYINYISKLIYLVLRCINLQYNLWINLLQFTHIKSGLRQRKLKGKSTDCTVQRINFQLNLLKIVY
jgi:hypothetical protein